MKHLSTDLDSGNVCPACPKVWLLHCCCSHVEILLLEMSCRVLNVNRALDETAVFGYCCRHDFPGKLKVPKLFQHAGWLVVFICWKQSLERPIQMCLSCMILLVLSPLI